MSQKGEHTLQRHFFPSISDAELSAWSKASKAIIDAPQSSRSRKMIYSLSYEAVNSFHAEILRILDFSTCCIGERIGFHAVTLPVGSDEKNLKIFGSTWTCNFLNLLLSYFGRARQCFEKFTVGSSTTRSFSFISFSLFHVIFIKFLVIVARERDRLWITQDLESSAYTKIMQGIFSPWKLSTVINVMFQMFRFCQNGFIAAFAMAARYRAFCSRYGVPIAVSVDSKMSSSIKIFISWRIWAMLCKFYRDPDWAVRQVPLRRSRTNREVMLLCHLTMMSWFLSPGYCRIFY